MDVLRKMSLKQFILSILKMTEKRLETFFKHPILSIFKKFKNRLILPIFKMALKNSNKLLLQDVDVESMMSRRLGVHWVKVIVLYEIRN